MRKLVFTTVWLLMVTSLCDTGFGQKAEVGEQAPESVQADVLIETFFTKRTGDLPEMLKLNQIRVLVVPSRSTYFLDKAGQPRGLDYELLKEISINTLPPPAGSPTHLRKVRNSNLLLTSSGRLQPLAWTGSS